MYTRLFIHNKTKTRTRTITNNKRQEANPEIYIQNLISNQEKMAIIPQQLLSQSIINLADTISHHRKGRMQGLIYYPCISSLIYAGSGNLSIALYILSFTSFCFTYHSMNIKGAANFACSTINRGIFLKNKENHEALQKWITENNITHLSFNDKSEVILSSNAFHAHLSPLAWLDKTSLKQSDNINKPNFSSSYFQYSAKNKINYFHLTEEVKNEINYILNSRSKRFRYSTLFAAINFLISSSTSNNLAVSVFASCMGAQFGHAFLKSEIDHNHLNLWDLLRKKEGVLSWITPEYQKDYMHIFDVNEKISIVTINTFGDIEFDSKYSLRKKTAFFMEKKIEENNVVIKQNSQQKYSPT